jgi:hypothetical protein
MAATTDAPTSAPATTDGDDIHVEALKRYERGFQKDRKNIDAAYYDLRFAADEDGLSQWDDKSRQERDTQGRPILTVNKCGQFVRQVTGDMRQMRPAIKCVPVDDRGDKEVAKTILPGMIRYIENRSDAQGTYFAAADSQVTAGIGHWRVLTEYADADTFEQELRIAPVEDGVAVVWDPDAILPTREDAMFCFVPVDMSRAAFEEQYPGKSADALTTVPEFFRSWFGDDHVRIAEYWFKEPAKRTLALLPDGGVDDLTDAEPDEIAAAKAQGARIEKRDGFKVRRAVISASDVLEEPTDWPGRHIPIIPVLGEVTKIGRDIVRRGVIRALRDPQRLYNYAISADAEVIALQPKAPFIGTKKHFDDHRDEWETANRENWPYLEYTPDPEAPGTKPERVSPPMSSVGIQELLSVSQADMNAVTGIYPASLGAASNEVSGRAIQARQREGDTGTFVYIDNFSRAIRHTARILIDLIPHVYDTARTILIVGEDGKIDKLDINQPALGDDGMTPITLRDVTIGAYHVVVEMGPSYSTKREEARDGIQGLMQALGPQAMLVADLFAKSQDWPLADQISKRLQALLPPQIQQIEAQESGEPPPPQMPPPPPSPEQQMAMEQHQARMQQQQQQQQFDGARLQLDQQKLQVEMAKINAEIQKAQLDHEATLAGHAATAAQKEPDPRVDELAQAVQGLSDMVMQIAQAIQQQQQAPPPDVSQGLAQLADHLGQQQQAHTQALADLISKPRRSTLVRGPDGRPSGAVSMIEPEPEPGALPN